MRSIPITTRTVGSMWCAYVFALFDLISLLGGDQFAAAQPAVAATSVSTNPARMMATRA